MTILASIHHHTRYEFAKPAILSPHEIRLRPAAHSRTPIQSYSLKIEPSQHFIHWQQDVYGNFVARLTFPQPTRVLDITVDLIADLTVINPFDFFIEPWAEHFPFSYPDTMKLELAPFLVTEPNGRQFDEWLAGFRSSLNESHNTTDMLVALNQSAKQRIDYLIRLEPGVQSPEQTLQLGSGSCRDSAWLMVQALRHLGIAARFVSGYLIQLKADEIPLDGPAGPAQDFTDLHAWCEAYLPGAGWVGLDTTSGLLAGEGHIPLAATAVPASAAPVFGHTNQPASEFKVDMQIQRVHEDPRVTLPYSEAEWQDINRLGEQVDQELMAQDVRLTQGGEPTFVASDNMDAAEWNTLALGEQKWQRAYQLMYAMMDDFAPGGVPHFGQGKWYPGESLPRWALTVLWRADGTPLWRERELIATEPTRIGQTDLHRFGDALCQQLGLDRQWLIAAYEDPWIQLDAESRLPDNIDPLQTDLDTPEERRRLARLLRRGLGQIAGLVLPLRAGLNKTWRSSPWPLRQPRLYLLPGDSPLGYRLPLASLPWVDAKEQPINPPSDPFAPRDVLPDQTQLYNTPAQPKPYRVDAKPKEIIHTALTLEIREGILYVFLPPLSDTDATVRLIARIEATAKRCSQPIRLEGYLPERDPRLLSFAVTPDPGVIEVNIHPSGDWNTLVARTQRLYEAARKLKLGSEKFMLDGRHTGTGGGNHITLGANKPADSPFLRRPDVLQSLITYWQHHPALSYLFSGQFIGPTSQAPRIDEARDDNLYEMELAFQQMDRLIPSGKECQQPWLVDRLLRNLLVDLTGNTHRAEFCIDKLYSPDSSTGRLGLLELRAFEMPPHYQMSLVQALLLRALISRFWKQPYRGPLVRWDTRLHDQFMLPHFIEQDMREICRELRDSGYPMQDRWFTPFMEFRFPRYGTLIAQNMELELRCAIEPWHVLGEEMSGNGTARYVDSSVERLQVKVSGMTIERHQITCNGRAIPLRSTGVPGEYVAGVRYKAWAPWSALHPSIGIHGPLVFDLVDRWNQRAIAGCTWHVSHPGGRNFDTFPVNANEAESRRRSRFWPLGHTPGTQRVTEEPGNPNFPFTLDLRRLA